ncbi:MAG: hypothetical protein ACRDY1_09660, partial [Acidimicrobiales bacterium]
MTPEPRPGVSDFGISGAAADHPSPGPDPTDPRFALAAEVRRLIAAMVGLPLADSVIAGAAAAVAAAADS